MERTKNSCLFIAIILVLSYCSGRVHASDLTITVTDLQINPVPTTRFSQNGDCFCPL